MYTSDSRHSSFAQLGLFTHSFYKVPESKLAAVLSKLARRCKSTQPQRKQAFPEAETEKKTAQSRPSRGAQCVLPSSSGISDFCKEPHESLLCSPQLTVWREPGPADRQQVLNFPRPGACCHTSLPLLHVFHATSKQPPSDPVGRKPNHQVPG